MRAHKTDWQNLDQYFQPFERLTKSFISQLDEAKVGKMNVSLPAQTLPNDGLSLLECVQQLEQNIIPQLSAARGPRYWGFVTGGATPIATMADWLVSTFDQNVAKAGDSVASLVEKQAMEWLCELFELPDSFRGVMPTGATGCNFLAACVARQFAGTQQGLDVAKEGVYNLDVEIFSTTPHASMIKGLGMAGLGQRSITTVNPYVNSEAMDVSHLASCLENSQAKSKIIIASSGTVTATDFDDLTAISVLSQQHNAWLHVDAAFGLFERIVEGTNGKTRAIENADSITVDCHKWLNVPYDSGVFLTRHLDLLEQSFDVPAPYLENFGNEPDYMSLGIENSRRFRAFPVWLTLLAYGREGIKFWVESNIKLAKKLANWIDNSDDYELVYPCQMNIVLFRPSTTDLTQREADNKTKKLLQKINQDGRLFLSPGVWQGNQIIRAALSNWQTDERDIDIAKEVLIQFAR